MASNITINDTWLNSIINFTLGIGAKGVEFGYIMISTLVDNWAITFAGILIVVAFLFALKKVTPDVNKYIPKLK